MRASMRPAISGRAALAAWRWMNPICGLPCATTPRSTRCVPDWSKRARTGNGPAPRAARSRAHRDGIIDTAPVLEQVPDFAALIRSGFALSAFANPKAPAAAGPQVNFLDRGGGHAGPRCDNPAKRGPEGRAAAS